MPNCPKCHRPVNEGNSPNPAECTETDDDEGVCEAYAKVHKLRTALTEIHAEGVGALNNAFPEDAPEVVESMAQKAELALKNAT